MSTPTLAEIKTMSAPTLVELASRLGFSFSPSSSGPDSVLVTPPAKPPTGAVATVTALYLRLRDPALSTAVTLAATAAGLHSAAGLKQAAPPPPKKINTKNADGSPISLPPPPEPLPPPAPFRIDDPVDDWLSDADLNQQLHAITTEATVIDGRLIELGEPHDDEDHAVFDQRQRYTVRLARLTERHRLLRDERSRRFDKHVEATARDRASGRR